MTLSFETIQRDLTRLTEAAHSRRRISGLTHEFYKYPARFTPEFARAAIETFTKPGQLVVDPFMGGGTTLVEARALGRYAIGTDVSELATFVTRVKTWGMRRSDAEVLREWLRALDQELRSGTFTFSDGIVGIEPNTFENLRCEGTRNLVQVVATAVERVNVLPTERLQAFARAIVLRAAQIAIDGNQTFRSPARFGELIGRTGESVLESSVGYARTMRVADAKSPSDGSPRTIVLNGSATNVDSYVAKAKQTPSLVLTSPPYPGINVLYHRWQVHGGKETALPFWITDTKDGRGNAFYQMHARANDLARYYETVRETFGGMRRYLDRRAHVIQLVAFANPRKQLREYLQVMEEAGYVEQIVLTSHGHRRRIIRTVPYRNWYAHRKGVTPSCREYVLIHRLQS